MWRPDAEDGRLLLRVARAAVAEKLLGDARSLERVLAEARARPPLERLAAVFVSLHAGSELRGCLGTLEATEPLALAVSRHAAAAALEDPRFPPLGRGELPGVQLAVSVLGPLTPVRSAEVIEVGRHGVSLTLRDSRAVFLPEVATQQGWDREALLENLALKAGILRPDWRQAALAVFETAAFEETESVRYTPRVSGKEPG